MAGPPEVSRVQPPSPTNPLSLTKSPGFNSALTVLGPDVKSAQLNDATKLSSISIS